MVFSMALVVWFKWRWWDDTTFVGNWWRMPFPRTPSRPSHSLYHLTTLDSGWNNSCHRVWI